MSGAYKVTIDQVRRLSRLEVDFDEIVREIMMSQGRKLCFHEDCPLETKMDERRLDLPDSETVALAKRFHSWYEVLAPKYDYKTRSESAVPWDELPKNNRTLMVAVCRQILDETEISISDSKNYADALEEIILWALGEQGEFPRKTDKKKPYWWRTELRKRFNAAKEDFNKEALKE